MKKLTIKQMITLLPIIQEGMCQGEIEIFSENLLIPSSLRDELKIGNSKMLLAYIGIENGCDPTYLAFIENEGGATFNLPFTPDEVYEGNKPTVSPKGLFGFAKEKTTPANLMIIWDDKRPKAKIVGTGEIIELSDLPNEPIMTTTQEFFEDETFNIKFLLFGNPNVFGYYPGGMEWAVNLLNTDTGKTSEPFTDNFITSNIAKLRENILLAGENATYKEIDAIFRKNNDEDH